MKSHLRSLIACSCSFPRLSRRLARTGRPGSPCRLSSSSVSRRTRIRRALLHSIYRHCEACGRKVAFITRDLEKVVTASDDLPWIVACSNTLLDSTAAGARTPTESAPLTPATVYWLDFLAVYWHALAIHANFRSVEILEEEIDQVRRVLLGMQVRRNDLRKTRKEHKVFRQPTWCWW